MIEGPRPPDFKGQPPPALPLRMVVAQWFRRVVALRSPQRWALEIVGVGALAVAGWLIFPAAAFIVVGIYAIVVANSEEE